MATSTKKSGAVDKGTLRKREVKTNSESYIYRFGGLRDEALHPDINELLEISAGLQRAEHRLLRAFSKKAKLSERGIYILAVVHAGLDRPSGLIEYFDLLPSTITIELEKLAAAKLIVRTTDPEDRRSTRLQLTKRGIKTWERVTDLLNTAFKPRMELVSKEELRICIETLRKIAYPVDLVDTESEN